jgi:CDP-diacylglycerol--serine O-phosphatidyltransferase
MQSIALAAGLGGEPDLWAAGGLILLAAVFDTVDGAVARLTGTGSEFGIQLDSLVDAMSFCIAPALLIYAWGAHELGLAGLGASFFFALCGVFRLARFNCEADGTKSPFGKGLATTMAGSCAASAVMTHQAWGLPPLEPGIIAGLSVALGLLMVSTVPYRSHTSLLTRRGKLLVYGSVFGGMALVALLVNISTSFLAGQAAYALVGPIELATRKLLGRPYPELPAHQQPHLDEEDGEEARAGLS